MPEFFSNNATSTLASGILAAATSCSVDAGHGVRWPTLGTNEWCWSTITDGTDVEIIKVTAIATDAFTIERGQQGTTAQDWSTGATIELRLTKNTLTELQGRVDYITNLSSGNNYRAQSASDFIGNDFIWLQCVYRRVKLGAPATIIGRMDGTGGFALVDEGYNFVNGTISINARGSTGAQTTVATINSVFDRHWIHVGVWIAALTGGDYESMIYINGTQRASGFVASGGGFVPADPALLFQVGNTDTIEVAGFSYKAGSAISHPTADQMGALFDACYEANDVVNGGLTWDNTFSVKRNTPGATWSGVSGILSLDRQGSPTNSYKTKPLWL